MQESRPTKLLSVVHYHQEPKTQPSPHGISKGLEVVELMTRGRGWLWHEGAWVEVLPGMLLWHVEGDETIGRSDPDRPYSCLAVRMESSAAVSRRVPRLSYWHDTDAVAQLTEEAIGLFLDESFDDTTLLDYLYSKLRLEATVYHLRREKAGVSEPLRVVRSIIEKRFAEPLRVSDLAASAGWSVAHLHDQFKRVYGSTPRQELLNKRLRVARELLVSTGLSIKQIAAATGFTHSSAFCSAFRVRSGATPKSYRDAYFFGYGSAKK